LLDPLSYEQGAGMVADQAILGIRRRPQRRVCGSLLFQPPVQKIQRHRSQPDRTDKQGTRTLTRFTLSWKSSIPSAGNSLFSFRTRDGTVLLVNENRYRYWKPKRGC